MGQERVVNEGVSKMVKRWVREGEMSETEKREECVVISNEKVKDVQKEKMHVSCVYKNGAG